MAHILSQANFITSPKQGPVVPCFSRALDLKRDVGIRRAVLHASALGAYTAAVDGQPVGDFFLAPGWTEYSKRLQFQSYDVTRLLRPDSVITALLGEGWWGGRLGWEGQKKYQRTAFIAALEIEYEDGSTETVLTDRRWRVMSTPILSSSIYDGETVDMTAPCEDLGQAELFEYDKSVLTEQEGEIVCEQISLAPQKEFVTPKGERVIDFGQNLTGYVRVLLKGQKGEKLELSFAEVLDRDGNFYTENMRSAKNKILVTLGDEGEMEYAPTFSFQGFRFIRLDQCPKDTTAADFTAVAVSSDIRQTGSFECGVPLVNQLYRNILWGQRGNFLDVPTDCPQRDERLGWTGDAEVFCRAASYNYKVDRFFAKWLHDMTASQREDGIIPNVVPNVLGPKALASSAWGDASVIIPWQMYETYGEKQFLIDQFDTARAWVDHMGRGENRYVWKDEIGENFGDWLGLDAFEGSYRGATDKDLICNAYYAYSAGLLIRMGHALGRDMSEYEALREGVIRTWQENYLQGDRVMGDTQTGYVLALAFGLCPEERREVLAARLAEKIRENDNHLQTGFVGTPYLLRALSDTGYASLAYTLLLQTTFPSWLYPVTKGATTIWEHWDGVKPDGSMWSSDMNSFNHYAYGAVADWMFNVCAGIEPDAENPGFRRIHFRPIPDARMGYVRASIQTAQGTVGSSWEYGEDGKVKYTFTVPAGCTADAEIDGQHLELTAGVHTF